MGEAAGMVALKYALCSRKSQHGTLDEGMKEKKKYSYP